MKVAPLVLGIGEVLWDLYPETQVLGGAVANVALHARALGAQGGLVSAVGEDDLGAAIVNRLSSELNHLFIRRVPDKPTGSVKVTVTDGQPSFECTKDVAFDYIEWCNSCQQVARMADAVVFGTLAQRNDVSRKTIQRFIDEAAHAVKVFDVNFRGWNQQVAAVVSESLPKTDILKINDDELKQLKDALGSKKQSETDFIRELQSKNTIVLVALSKGAEGCELFMNGETASHPGFNVKVTDTTGSGDAFLAGLLIEWFKKKPLSEVAAFANAVGAATATFQGALPQYSLEQIHTLIQTPGVPS